MISLKGKAVHDWTPHSPPQCKDGVEYQIESCQCGARRRRAVRMEQDKAVNHVVVSEEYPNNTVTGFQKRAVPAHRPAALTPKTRARKQTRTKSPGRLSVV